MATSDQRRALLAVPCGWCGAAPGELCTTRAHGRTDSAGGRRRGRALPVTTLDGGCHDTRWQTAGLGGAPVLAERVAEIHPQRPQVARQAPAMAGAGAGAADDVDRPW